MAAHVSVGDGVLCMPESMPAEMAEATVDGGSEAEDVVRVLAEEKEMPVGREQ